MGVGTLPAVWAVALAWALKLSMISYLLGLVFTYGGTFSPCSTAFCSSSRT